MMKNFFKDLIYQYQRFIEYGMKKDFDGRFVAMFHQIEDNTEKWYDSQYAITFFGFQLFVNSVQKMGYEIVSPYDILVNDGKKKVALTFDDAFEGVYYFAYPFLKQHALPFTVFPAINKLKTKGFMDEKMLLKMVNDYPACYVGAHSLSHCNLRQLSNEKCRKEIIESGEKLEEVINMSVKIFAYPFGSLDAVGKREQSIASEKYRIAYGTLQGGVTKNVNSFYIPRININEKNYLNFYN